MLTPTRRQQVFVSSTYLDLKEERQAAVQAILTAGHIPAGMELFAAADRSQLEVIKRWIEDSDIFMLILGGRYGSIEPESGKSYVQVEYEYAATLGKPHFAVYMSDAYLETKLKEQGSTAIERESYDKYKDFRALVKSKLCKEFGDLKDIKLAVHETLPTLIRDREPLGWVRASTANEGSVLIGQIKDLQEQVQTLKGTRAADFNGHSFEEACDLLRSTTVGENHIFFKSGDGLSSFTDAFRERNGVQLGFHQSAHIITPLFRVLVRLGLIEGDSSRVSVSALGHRFLAMYHRAHRS